MAPPKNGKWEAWEDRMPPNPPGPTLHVAGEVETTNSRIVGVLNDAVPQGFNPRILLLKLTLVDQGGAGTTDIRLRPIKKYEKDVSADQYETVQILWESEPVATLKVKIVQ